MMYGYGSGGWWMMLMPLALISLIALVVWVAVWLNSANRAETPRETPLEILTRRYAQGEIDDAAFATARSRLTGRESSTP